MASRAELRICCKELGINSNEMNLEEMKEAIKEEADKRFYRRSRVGIKDLSETLLKFLTLEYDYCIIDKKGKKVSYKEVE